MEQFLDVFCNTLFSFKQPLIHTEVSQNLINFMKCVFLNKKCQTIIKKRLHEPLFLFTFKNFFKFKRVSQNLITKKCFTSLDLEHFNLFNRITNCIYLNEHHELMHIHTKKRNIIRNKQFVVSFLHYFLVIELKSHRSVRVNKR